MPRYHVGKVKFLDMYPLSFDEFLDGAGKERLAELIRKHDLTKSFPETAHEKLWELWKHYLIVGGLPDAVGVPLSGFVKENRFKLYFFDVDLLGTASGIAPATFLNYDFGKSISHRNVNCYLQRYATGRLK